MASKLQIPSQLEFPGLTFAGYQFLLDIARWVNSRLLETVLDIGDWNMDATASVNVAHGLTLSKIRHIWVAVRHDDGSVTVPFPFGGVNTVYADATNIVLTRDTGGSFDGTGYDSTSYNRGWIIIEHIA